MMDSQGKGFKKKFKNTSTFQRPSRGISFEVLEVLSV